MYLDGDETASTTQENVKEKLLVSSNQQRLGQRVLDPLMTNRQHWPDGDLEFNNLIKGLNEFMLHQIPF